MQACRDGHHDVYLRPRDVPEDEPDAPNFATEITDFVHDHGRRIDSWVWDHYLANPKGM